MCKTFQSTSTPLVLNIARASSAIASNPPVANARIVGPAPERQIPNNPGWVSGVMFDVTSGKPGIWIADELRVPSEARKEAGMYQFLTIRLVYSILHRLVDESGIGRVCGENGGQDGETL